MQMSYDSLGLMQNLGSKAFPQTHMQKPNTVLLRALQSLKGRLADSMRVWGSLAVGCGITIMKSISQGDVSACG